MTTVKITDDNIFAALTLGSWILLFLLITCGFIFGSSRFATGILAGGLLAIINFYWLYSIISRAILLPAAKASSFTLIRYFLRLGIIAIVTSILIIYFNIDLIGLFVGLSVLVINLLALLLHRLTINGG